jgi:hypothetical protein
MKVRTNIKEVFDYLIKNGFDVDLGESCCSSTQSYPSNHKWIRAVAENDDQMMDDINGEGCAEVSWIFGPQDKISLLAETIVDAFTKKGYIVGWNKRMGGKITAVIEIDDLPISFLNKWDGNNSENEDNDFIEERIDPDTEVIFNKEDDERSIFSSEEEEEEEEDDSKSEPLIDPSSEEDEDTMCPEGCDCVNCEEERDD